MASNPEVRERLIDGLRQRGGVITVDRVIRLRYEIGMSDVSRREFNSALGSLRYKHRKLSIAPSSDGRATVVRLV